ncbi:MAG: excinuclease ABC subunit UvrC, partial [Candidatus Tectomicrobia bacterium]
TALREQIDRFPRTPGVYLMQDAKGTIVYVGKAKNLRNRVRQYYSQSGDPRYHIRLGLPTVMTIDFIVTNTEKEALILENTLIKKHRPRFNISLRDDKSHVHLRLDPKQAYPRLTVIRRPGKDKALYFGPYASSQAVRETLRILYRAFPVRSCTDAVFNSRTRPCLYYQIGQCVAPCVPGYTTEEAYQELVQQIILHLRGRSDDIIKTLKAQIAQASEDLRFEDAARLYKRLQAVQETVGKQRVTAMKQRDQDIFGYYRAADTVQIQTLNVRSGQLVGGRPYTFTRQLGSEADVLSSFIFQYYADNPYIPREVLLPCQLEDATALSELLTEKKGRQVLIEVPQKGDKHHLVQLAMKNAALAYQKEHDADEQQRRTLDELQSRLHLCDLPQRIECFDISNISGTLAVGSMVCFQDGQPNKQRYRRYRIKTLDGPNDFGMMLEVLRRRYRRALEEHDLPDLLLVDGGKGQLQMALRALEELGITDLEVAGIAKSRLKADAKTGVRQRSDERLYRPHRKNAVTFSANSPALFLLQRIRDEAHRFAITYHKTLRRKQALHSELDDIPGVGAQRKTQLLRYFGSLKQVRSASLTELTAVPSLPERIAQAVYIHFHGTPVA